MLNASTRVAKIFPIAEAKMECLKRLESSSLGYTVVINGYFLDYWVVPNVKSYLGGPLLAIDIELETLRAGQLTELPSHVAGYTYFPKPMLQSFFSSFSILFEEGYLNLQPEKTLNDQFPDIKARTVKDLLTEAWQGK
jgi:hypothetical protein